MPTDPLHVVTFILHFSPHLMLQTPCQFFHYNTANLSFLYPFNQLMYNLIAKKESHYVQVLQLGYWRYNRERCRGPTWVLYFFLL